MRDAASCEPIPDTRYLRGAQVTNNEGVVEFTTIYPGWYQGRTVHIHAKVHLGTTTVLTTQLYFDDALSDSGSPPRARTPTARRAISATSPTRSSTTRSC